jgi:hypothetical protein
MSGAGHILDMINRMKQNRAQRPSNRHKFKQNSREIINSESDIEFIKPIFKVVPEKELIEIINRIQERSEIHRKRERILNVVFVVFGLIAFIGFMIWMN